VSSTSWLGGATSNPCQALEQPLSALQHALTVVSQAAGADLADAGPTQKPAINAAAKKELQEIDAQIAKLRPQLNACQSKRDVVVNANGNVHQLETSDGTVLTTPLSLADLHGHYRESWRVAPADPLLADCGGAAIEHGSPTKPFLARDLDTTIYNSARAICTNAGVKDPVLLDACTLDVAVLGTADAATVYVGAPAPVAVGEAGQTKQG